MIALDRRATEGGTDVADWSLVLQITAIGLKDGLSRYEGADGPALQCLAGPRTPTAARPLLRVTNGFALRHVDQYQVGIVTDCDAPFADQSPHARRGVAHPSRDLCQSAALLVDLV